MRRLVVVALVAFGGLSVPAGAHHLPVSVDWKSQHALPIAEAAWPSSPCAGRLEVRSDATTDASLIAAGLDGRQPPGGCVLEVRSSLPPVRFCSVVVHEAGHAAGMGHSENPDDVMAVPTADYAPCEALAPPTHLRALAREETARWRSHRWRCRGTTRVQKCVGYPRHRSGYRGYATLTRLPDGTVEVVRSYR